MRCKRCGQTLLLRSERDLALCGTCQEVLRRPPLIETAFERTNNELSYFVDDLYTIDERSLAPHATSPPSPPACPVPSGLPEGLLTVRTPTSQPSPLHRLRPDGTLLFLTILTIFGTIFAIWHLRPHFVGITSLDVLVIVGVCWLWAQWWKALRPRKGGRTNGR
jgi:hypothetical protein